MKLILFLICISVCSNLNSQGILTGNVLDSISNKPLPLATATIFKIQDTSLVTYRLSNPEGKLRISNLPFYEPLYVIISYSNYEVYRKEFIFSDSTSQLDLGNISMIPSIKTLDEVLVFAERPPVRVYRDTIEFNAASFKTLPTALVEDLLKKLPGVQVDQGGNITVNGRNVNRILVDGKFFFGNDPKMATRNLPADMIDKVQVIDDQQEIERSKTGDLTGIGKVINLTLKKSIKKGWFGKVYGGYGNKERFEAGGIANIYRDTLQLSVLGYTNNINRSGFTLQDITGVGGFERSGINSLNIVRKNGNEGFSINGVSFGGLDEGVARSHGAGINLNHAPSTKFNLFGQYFLGFSHNDIQTINRTEQFIRDTTITTFTQTKFPGNTATHNINLGMNLIPSNYTSIGLQLSSVFNNQYGNATSSIQTNNDKIGGSLSEGEGVLKRNLNSNYYGSNLFITLKSKKKQGRILNLHQDINYKDDKHKYTSETKNVFFYPISDTIFFNQLRDQQMPSRSLHTQLNYTEPVSKQWILRLNNSYKLSRENQDISLFEKDPLSGEYILKVSDENNFIRNQQRFLSSLAVAYNIKDFTLTLTANGLWQQVQNTFQHTGGDIDFETFDFLPGFSIFWKNISFTFTKDVVVPAINYLVPVPDSTNPFFLIYGNQSLRSAKRNAVNLNFFKFYQSSYLGLNFYLRGSTTKNDVILSRVIDASGIQRVFPVNVNHTSQFTLGAGLNKDFRKNTKFTFTLGLNPYFSYSETPLLINNVSSRSVTTETGPKILMGFDFNNVVELRPSYTITVNKTTYSNNQFPDLQVLTQNLQTELLIYWPWKIIWQSNFFLRYNNKVAPGLPKQSMLWNFAAAIPVFKNDRGQLKFSIYDLLNQNNSFSRYSRENFIADQRVNVLNRYGLLTFTFNFQNLNSTKQGSDRRRLFIF